MANFPSPPLHARVARSLFWLACTFAVVMALLPHPPNLPLDSYGDKFEHILAFATLAFLANFGFPRMERLRLVERLSFLGAVIEVVQSVPDLGRDCDIRDWLADSLAVLAVTAGFAVWSRYRRSA